MKKLAILGPGVVGGSCAEILLRDADLLERNAGEQLELAYVLARRALPDRPYKDKVVTDFSVIEHDADVFLVIETIGGCGAARVYVRRALAAGKHVVTANKQLIAEHGAEVLALAKANGVNLLFEASVGGGIPVLHPLSPRPREATAASSIRGEQRRVGIEEDIFVTPENARPAPTVPA